MSKRIIAAFFSDTHAWSKVGLRSPHTEIITFDEEGNETIEPVTLNPIQQYLWDVYDWAWDEVEKLAGKDEIVVFHNGDLTQGQRYTDQLVDMSPGNQKLCAVANMERPLSIKNVKRMFITLGTPSHIFNEGSAPILVTKMLREKYRKKRIDISGHFLVEMAGKVFDIAHHGVSPGSRKWLKGNVFRYYMRSAYLSDPESAPDFFIRSHYHEFVDDILIDQFKGVRKQMHGIITPSFQHLTDYARQAVKSPGVVENGLVAVELFGDGNYKLHPFTQSKDARSKHHVRI